VEGSTQDNEGSPYAGERDLAAQERIRAKAHPDEVGGEARPGWYEHEGERRYWDGDKWGRYWADPQRPGWHERNGTLRYFDGDQWTDHIAPPYPSNLTTGGIAGAVAIGILVAFFLIWLGAQISPEHVYLPVKFVVKELP
jgi:hypothetical protein